MKENRSFDSFSKWRQRIWPVHGYELKKFFPLLLIKLCISFIYTVLHATKDTLIVTSKDSGAETIPILKGGVVLFFAFFFMLIYAKLSNHLSKHRLFYVTLVPFILFFALYGFFLYPNRDWLSPTQTADWLVSHVGVERSHWIAVYRYWMDSLFFLMAELWGGVVILLSFWGFVNRISTLNEASRFYTLFSAGGHIGVIIAGPLIWHLAHTTYHFSYTVKYLMGIVSAVGVLVLLVYWWMNRSFSSQEKTDEKGKQEETMKLSLKESIKHLLRCPSLGCIALMVIGYGFSVNMIEVAWKATLKMRYPNPQEYEAFMGILTSAIGCLSLLLAFFVGGNVIRRFGWYVGAQATPIVLGSVSLLFLGIYFATDLNDASSGFLGIGALSLLVFFGALHNVFCKSMKYCLFDPTKEMAYIPLDEETKVKGKAAVDVVASRFAKSGSSWMQAAFMELAGVGSILMVVPYLAPFVLLVVLGWVFAVVRLRRQLEAQTFSFSQ